MKRKVYYLNWETIEQNREDGDNGQILNRMMFGFRKQKRKKPNLQWYRVHEYYLQSESLEGIFCELNADDRFNGKEERSLSIGDIIEFDGCLYGVDIFGFTELEDIGKLIVEELNQIEATMNNLLNLWMELEDTSFLDENYPFRESFDEVVAKVDEWNNSVKKNLGLY